LLGLWLVIGVSARLGVMVIVNHNARVWGVVKFTVTVRVSASVTVGIRSNLG